MPSATIDPWTFATDLIFIVGFIFIATAILRKNHAREIYLIWYYNSFCFLIFCGMEVWAKLNGRDLFDVCNPYQDSCRRLHEMLTNTKHELAFLGIAVGIAIGPQLLTYFLAGLSGAASAPRYVRQIQTVTVWSLVKFLAGLGGIIAAEPLATMIVRRPVSAYDLAFIMGGLAITTVAFTLAALYVFATENIPPFFRWCYTHFKPARLPYRWLIKLHRFFTRHVRN